MQSLENQLYNPMLYQIWSTGAPFGTLAVVDDEIDHEAKFYLEHLVMMNPHLGVLHHSNNNIMVEMSIICMPIYLVMANINCN